MGATLRAASRVRSWPASRSASVREDQIVDVLADGLLRLEPEQGGRCRVPARDPLVAVHGHDRDRADLDERFEVRLLAIELGGPVLDAPFEGRDVRPELGGHLVERHGERPDLVLGLDPRDGFEVARGHLGGGRGQLQDRPGDPAGHEPDPAGEQDRRHETDQPDDQGQLARGAEGLVLADLGEESRPAVGDPAVDPDDGDTAIVDVQALAALAGADLADALGIDRGGLPGLGRPLDEPPVAVDEVGPSGLAQAGPLEDDPVEPLEAEVRGQDRHPLTAAVLVEQRRGHRDRRPFGQRRRVDVLDGRVRRTVGEVGLVGLGHALVLGQRRQPDLAVEVEDEDLLGVRGLADDRLEVGPKPRRGVALRGRASAAGSRKVRASSPKPGIAPT